MGDDYGDDDIPDMGEVSVTDIDAVLKCPGVECR